MSRFSTRPTPNPNSLMVLRTDGGRFLESGLQSYTSIAQAASDPLAIQLFNVPGVAGVLIMPAFITITRTPGTSWDALLPDVEAILDASFPG